MKALVLAVALTVPLGLDLYIPIPADNPLVVEKIEQGRRLFFDRRLSRDESIACASCHDPSRAFSDGRRVALGVFGRAGRRNAPAIVNRAYGRLFFWDGRETSLEAQVLKPIQDAREMDLGVSEVQRRVGLPAATIATALASYVRSILSGNSAFDRFVDGHTGALTDREKRGLAIFRDKGHCTRCHVGPNFTDERLHNTGVAWNGEHLTDDGGGRGDFKTPTLRDVAKSAPYMHDGSLATLEDVIDFYDRGGRPNPTSDPEIRPLNLTADDKRALVSFLDALTGS